MSGLIIPNTFTAGTKAKAAEVNENFTAIQDYADGGLPVADLADGTSGQIIVCNGSGVPTYVSPSGPVSLSTAGVNAIEYEYAQQAFDTNLDDDGVTFTDISGLSITLGSGEWLVMGTIYVEKGTTAGLNTVIARLVDSGVTTTHNAAYQKETTFEISAANLTLFSRISTAGRTVKIQATTLHAGGTSVCKSSANSFLAAIRVA